MTIFVGFATWKQSRDHIAMAYQQLLVMQTDARDRQEKMRSHTDTQRKHAGESFSNGKFEFQMHKARIILQYFNSLFSFFLFSRLALFPCFRTNASDDNGGSSRTWKSADEKLCCFFGFCRRFYFLLVPGFAVLCQQPNERVVVILWFSIRLALALRPIKEKMHLNLRAS